MPDIEAIPDLICPDCGTCSIVVNPHPGPPESTDRPVGKCSRCGKTYDTTVLPTFEQRFEEIRRAAREEPCPACGNGPRAARSLCDRTARECFFVVSCEGCGDVRLA